MATNLTVFGRLVERRGGIFVCTRSIQFFAQGIELARRTPGGIFLVE